MVDLTKLSAGLPVTIRVVQVAGDSDAQPAATTSEQLVLVHMSQRLGVTQSHATLRKALNDAVAQKRITDNPARHVELESARRPKPVAWTRERVIEWMRTGNRPKVAVWTPVQTGFFLDYAAGDRLYAYYHLLVFRGPRRGEGIGLRWLNVDLDAAVMDVREQIIQVGWETEVSSPKSGSDGLVALDAATVKVLRAHRKRQMEERLAWGAAWAGTSYVFTTETGQPVHPDYASRHFVRMVRQANRLGPGSQGQAVEDVQLALGVEPSGLYAEEARRAVSRFQRQHEGLTANGIVDPHTWYRLFADEPLRPYPHPGYLPPIRLHDLRHLAATLALTAGVQMKVVSEMLRHKTLAITSDTYTLVALDYRIAAEILLLFYEDLAARGQADPLPDVPPNGWHPLAERLSYRDQTLDEDLMHLGISPHPRVVLAIEGETEQIHVPLIWKQLDYPDAPELLRLLMLGGVDRDLEKVAALAAAPLIGQKAPSQNPAWLLIKPPTCLYIAVDPEGQYFAPANVPQTRTAILNEIRAVLRAQGVRAANPAEVEELVRICTCYCPAMQPGR